MTSIRLIFAWVVLAIIAMVGNMIYENNLDHVRSTAVRMAPKYKKVTDAEAIRQAYMECETDVEEMTRWAEAGVNCEQAYSAPVAEIVTLAHRSHQSRFDWKEIKPLERDLEFALVQKMDAFKVVLLILAGLAFLLWCRSTLWLPVGRLRARLAESASLAEDLKGAGASLKQEFKTAGAKRKVRQAESDFATLKNLHNNGLISDEMFASRKAELKDALSENEMFKS